MHDLKGVTFDDEKTTDEKNGIITDDGLRLTAKNIKENQWNEQVAVTANKQFFIVRVNGAVVSTKFGTNVQAEQHIQSLPDATQFIAEIVQVDEHGNEMLLG